MSGDFYRNNKSVLSVCFLSGFAKNKEYAQECGVAMPVERFVIILLISRPPAE